MTSIHKLAASLVIAISVFSLGVNAQSVGPELKNFAADGISFDYPAEYSVKDESTAQTQQFILTRKGSSVQLTIVSGREVVLNNELPAAIENTTEPLIKQVALKLTDGQKPPERTSIKTQIGPKEAEGVQLRSSDRSTGEVIWLRLGLRLISMALVRSNTDDSAGSQLWQTVRSSLRIESPTVLGAMKTEAEPTGKPITGSVLNGKALALPQPTYPPLARAAHASGSVLVQVLADIIRRRTRQSNRCDCLQLRGSVTIEQRWELHFPDTNVYLITIALSQYRIRLHGN